MIRLETILRAIAVFMTSNFFVLGYPGHPDNQNLDPNDQTPGHLIPPDRYYLYLAPLPKRIEPWDPTYDEVNKHMVYYRNNPKYFLWDKPPCQWFQKRLDSVPNQGRQDGCYHIMKRLKKDMKKERKKNNPPSINCSGAYDAECFQFNGQGGRCYIKVDLGPGLWNQKYVLIDNCD